MIGCAKCFSNFFYKIQEKFIIGNHWRLLNSVSNHVLFKNNLQYKQQKKPPPPKKTKYKN